MKRIMLAAATVLVASPLFAAEPVVAVPPMRYGRIDTAEFPSPQTISDQPTTGQGSASSGSGPLYLHVPAGHAKSWDKYCQQYQACGRPVYFVRDDWYKNVYTARYNASHPKTDAAAGDKSDRQRDERGTDADSQRGNLDRGVGDRGKGTTKGR